MDLIDRDYRKWIKTDNLLVDLWSLETGFRNAEKDRRDVWDYIEWRETVLVGPPDASCRDGAVAW